jgi:hypothetical protein
MSSNSSKNIKEADMPKNILMVTATATIIALAVGFYGGMWYQKSQAPNMANFPGGQTGTFTRGGNGTNAPRTPGNMPQAMAGQTTVRGEILELGDGTLTIQLTGSQGSQIVLWTDKTQVSQTIETDSSALVVGKMVMIFGQESDGVFSAESIQVSDQLNAMDQ